MSLFNKLNMKNSDTIFYKHYIKEVNKLTNANKFVKFIDTKKYLNSKDKDKELFCILYIKIIREKLLPQI